LDTLRKYVEVVGGEISVEVSIGDERFLIAKNESDPRHRLTRWPDPEEVT